MLQESVGNVLEEDHAQDNMFVIRGFNVVAELIRRPKLFFKAQLGSILLGPLICPIIFHAFRHECHSSMRCDAL